MEVVPFDVRMSLMRLKQSALPTQALHSRGPCNQLVADKEDGRAKGLETVVAVYQWPANHLRPGPRKPSSGK